MRIDRYECDWCFQSWTDCEPFEITYKSDGPRYHVHCPDCGQETVVRDPADCESDSLEDALP